MIEKTTGNVTHTYIFLVINYMLLRFAVDLKLGIRYKKKKTNLEKQDGNFKLI